MSKIAAGVVLSLVLLVLSASGQNVDLDSLYLSKPSNADLLNIIRSFHIVLKDGGDPYEKWNLYDPYLFDQTSTSPSVYPLVNTLRVIREERFSVPLPFANGDVYTYMLDHFRNGGIYLQLDTLSYWAGSDYINLGDCVFWDTRISGDEFTPQSPFVLDPYVYLAQLLVHETRHCDPDAPGHIEIQYDASLADEGAYGRACIYLMWVWKYGLNFGWREKTAAGAAAMSLMDRFLAQPVTHPNPAIQSVLDELIHAQVLPLKADAGGDTVIVIPHSQIMAAVRLDGSRSYSIGPPIVQYRWSVAMPPNYFTTTRPDTTVLRPAGVYKWQLEVKDQWGAYSATDTMMVTIIRSSSSVANDRSNPAHSELIGNYPNPFNPQTEICYTLAASGQVRIEIFDILGHPVAVLVDGLKDTGDYRTTFNGEGLPVGVYLCRLQAPGLTQVRRMLLLR
jgi:hypothetical protein